MGAAAFFEILEDAALQLIDRLESLALHEQTEAFSQRMPPVQNMTIGCSFISSGSQPYGIRELPEVIDARGQCVAESAEFDFVIIARVQQGDRPAFIQPLLEFPGRTVSAKCGSAGSIPSIPKAMISFLILTSIRRNGWDSLSLTLTSRDSRPGMARRRTSSDAMSSPAPATKRLMPSVLSRMILSDRLLHRESNSSRSGLRS